MPVQRRWPSRLAALISLTLVGCAQGDATTTPAATQEVPPTPIVVIVTATPTPTPLPGRPPDTPTPIIIVVTATPSLAAAPLSSATSVPSPTPSSTALPLPTQTTPTPEATATATPAPTPTEVTTSIPTPTPTPTPEATAAVPPTPTSTAPLAPTLTPTVAAPLSQVVLQTVNLETEVVTIINLGNALQNMTGWMLISEVGGQAFRFPSGYTLAPGATVLVTSGPNGYLAPPAVLQWLKSDGTPSKGYVWNNDGDTALLMDADGNTVSRFP